MQKINFTMVERQVNKMYDFSIMDPEAIEIRCLDIQSFIEACGWSIDDYIREMMGYNKKSYLN